MEDLMPTLKAVEAAAVRYHATILFPQKVLGTKPESPEVLAAHLERLGVAKDEIRRQVAALRTEAQEAGAEEEADFVESAEKKARTTFLYDDDGPVLQAVQFNAMLREMLSCRGTFVSKKGTKQTFQHMLSFHALDASGKTRPAAIYDMIPTYDAITGKRLTEPTGTVEMTANVSTPMGPRSIVKQHRYMENVRIYLEIRVNANARIAIPDAEIAACLACAQTDGIGACRSQGYGTLRVERLVRI